MTNAEKIARDICLLVGHYERREITAKGLVNLIEYLYLYQGCESFLFNTAGLKCVGDCTEGHENWLEAQV